MQRWLSGLRRTIGNRVTANTRPEVQILFSAPKKEQVFACSFLLSFGGARPPKAQIALLPRQKGRKLNTNNLRLFFCKVTAEL